MTKAMASSICHPALPLGCSVQGRSRTIIRWASSPYQLGWMLQSESMTDGIKHCGESQEDLVGTPLQESNKAIEGVSAPKPGLKYD